MASWESISDHCTHIISLEHKGEAIKDMKIKNSKEGDSLKKDYAKKGKKIVLKKGGRNYQTSGKI